MSMKMNKAGHPRTVSLSCPKCNRNLGAWKTFDVDEGGPDHAGPTLDALVRRGVRLDTPESGSVTFDCPNPTCTWRQVVRLGDVEEVVYWGAINGETLVGLSSATLWQAGRRRSERAPIPGAWADAPPARSPRLPDYRQGVASILALPTQPASRTARRIGRHAS